jgi:hypothetical protein
MQTGGWTNMAKLICAFLQLFIAVGPKRNITVHALFF